MTSSWSASGSSSSGTLTPRLFLGALRARRRVFVVALATVVLGATVASLLMPRSYRATVALLVDAKDEQSLSDALRPLLAPQERVSYLQTQVDILSSPRVAREVVQQLHLAQNPAALAALGVKPSRDGRTEDRLVEALRHGFKTETSQSSVIQASFSSTDPNWAATIANAFATAYIGTMLELRVAPTRNAAAWFDEQIKALRANLEEAQTRLTHAKLAAQAKLSEHPERLPQVIGNPFIEQLRTELLHGEAKLQELGTQYGINHPVYRRQISENRALRAKLQAEMRKLAAGAASAEAAATPEEILSANHAGPQHGPGQPGGAGDARLGELVDPVLARNVETAEHAYETAMQRYVVSQVDSRASQTNVTVLNPAVAPLSAYRPNVPLNIALSLFTGVVLGGILVALLEMRDPVVRTYEDLLSVSRVPLLAVLGDERRRPRLLLGPPAAALRALPKPP